MTYNLVEYITLHPQAPGPVHAKASAEGTPYWTALEIGTWMEKNKVNIFLTPQSLLRFC